jgi:hypothetical protein
MSELALTFLLVCFYLQLAFFIVVYVLFQIRLLLHKEQHAPVNMFSEIVAEDASDVSILKTSPRLPAHVNATLDMASVALK